MTDHPVVSRAQWLEQRQALLAQEKAFTRERDALSAARRALPWVRIDTNYTFDGEDGPVTLAGLFGPLSQLIVQHFMFGRDWQDGCVSCSFWADNFNGIEPHLNARDIAFAAVSRGPLAHILPFKRRMGWTFPWVSSAPSTFSEDFQVSFAENRNADQPVTYNYRDTVMSMNEMPGVSVFAKDADGTLYHTYSTYGRGLDILNGAYNYIDLTPKGRDEAAEDYPMAWVRHHDRYDRTG